MAPTTRSQTFSTEFSELSLGRSSTVSPRTSDRVFKVPPQRRKRFLSARQSSNHKPSKTASSDLGTKALATKTFGELQSLCVSYKVNGKGTKDELTKRLVGVSEKGNKKNDDKCDAILVTESKIPGRQGTFFNAKQALLGALERDQLSVRNIKGQVFVVNQDAVNYAEAKMDIPDIQSQLNDRNNKLCKVTDQKDVKDRQVKMLEDRISGMLRQMDLHTTLRNRFISAYKRDKLNSGNAADKETVEKGNESVHSGDAVMDALLFHPRGPRYDVAAYKSLYGLTPSEVLDINHHETFTLLNRNASIAASKRDTYSATLAKSFENFTKLFKDSNFDQNYLLPGRRHRPLRRAYNEFWNCANRGTQGSSL